MNSDLDETQITVLQNFEVGFHIINTESWDTVFDSDVITVSSNLDGSEEQMVDVSGVVLLDQDNIKITVKEVDDKNSFWDAYIYVSKNVYIFEKREKLEKVLDMMILTLYNDLACINRHI